jgi:hypothetical protein
VTTTLSVAAGLGGAAGGGESVCCCACAAAATSASASGVSRRALWFFMCPSSRTVLGKRFSGIYTPDFASVNKQARGKCIARIDPRAESALNPLFYWSL